MPRFNPVEAMDLYRTIGPFLAALSLGCSPSTVTRLARTHGLAPRKRGRKAIYTAEEAYERHGAAVRRWQAANQERLPEGQHRYRQRKRAEAGR